MILDDTLPWERREQFPAVVGLSPEEIQAATAKWGSVLFGTPAAAPRG
jgi:hypothetical protein